MKMTIPSNADTAQYRRAFHSRLVEQDLTALELREQQRALRTQLHRADIGEQRRIMAEIEAYQDALDAQTAPPPTPEDRLAALPEPQGVMLGYTLAGRALREKVEAAVEKLARNPLSAPARKALEDARAAMQEHQDRHPMRLQAEERAELLQQADALLRSAPDSPEELRKVQDERREILDKAMWIGRTPPPAAPDIPGAA
jgi:hypothetical protein